MMTTLHNPRAMLVGLCWVIICYTISLDKLVGYPGINTRLGYPGIALVKLQHTRISQDNLGQLSFVNIFQDILGYTKIHLC